MTKATIGIGGLALAALLAWGAPSAAEDATPDPMDAVEQAYRAGDFGAARAGLLPLAEAGNPRAAYRLGYMIANGEGGPFERQAAIRWLEAALAGQHNAGWVLLARAYLSGAPEVPDYERAAELLQIAVARDSAEAHFYLAQLYRVGRGVEGNSETAFDLMRKAGDAGVRDAEYALAEMYSRGEGTVQDEAQARRWLLQAAESNHAEAQMSLYFNYSRGTGFPQSEELAAEWLNAAAGNGHTLAERVVGTQLLFGDPPEAEQGLALLMRAAQKGEAGAQSNLGYAYAAGIGVEADPVTSANWYRLAADQGLTRAALTMGELYASGTGVEQSLENAVQYYTIAVTGRDETAMARLGAMIVDARYPGEEPETSIDWVAKAAEAGSDAAREWLLERARVEPYASLQLAMIYAEGLGTDANAETAFNHYLKAAEAGYVAAQEALAERYASGSGIDQDYVEAHKWANVAASAGSEAAVERRNLLTNLMTTEQIAEAQTRAKAFLARP